MDCKNWCKYHTRCCSFWTGRDISWTTSFQNIHKFVPATWADLLSSAGKKHTGDKSWKFFKEQYIYDIYFGQGDGTNGSFVRARSHHSLRKNEEPHFLHLHVVSKLGRASVENAHCSCKVGRRGHCNHLFALLFQLNDFSCSKVNTVPSDSSCTSRRQEWHIPRQHRFALCLLWPHTMPRAATDRGSRK